VAEPRDEFPNNFVGDLVRTERGWVVVPTNVLPGRPRPQRPRLVGQLSVVHLQRPAHGLAVLVREIDLRSAARAALPNPRQRSGVDVGRRAIPLSTHTAPL
jgi:hypothetical protein